MRRSIRVPGGGVEVDYTVKSAATPDPIIDRFAYLFLIRVVIPFDGVAFEGVLKRSQRGADNPHPVQMCPGNELLVPLDDIVCGWLGFAWRQNTAGPADIVNPHHQNHGIGMRATPQIAMETRPGVYHPYP